MKIRSLLTIVAMLSILLFGIGTAYAVYGVPDDVPGQDLVWPSICVKTPGATNTLNTNWAIAELTGGTPDQNGCVAELSCALKSVTSVTVLDFSYCFTPFDVVTDNCAALTAGLTTTQKTALTQTYNGIAYLSGYIQCTQITGAPVSNPTHQIVDRFMNNVYIVDTPLGFASGFNGPSLEDGTGAFGASTFLGENGDTVWITAEDVFLRYFINNADPNTWDWWILLLGRNQYNTINITSTRILDGFICDEAEHCLSVSVPIPVELNVINVADFLPGSPLNTAFPRAGFGRFKVKESGVLSAIGAAGSFTITGTANNPAVTGKTYYSMWGWSYQRAVAASLIGDFDVIHPMFRTYCIGGNTGTGAAEDESTCNCSSTTSGCGP